MKLRLNRRELGVFALSSTLSVSSFAQSRGDGAWPARPITLVVPYPPGGTTDVVGRQLADHLWKELGQSVVVENKPGAATAIGASAVARAPKDGYTLLLGSGTTFTIAPHLIAKLPYAQADFEPIGSVCTTPFTLVVKNDLPIRNLKEFIAYAKANPKAINNATTGQGTIVHLLSELMDIGLGTQMTNIHYKGAAQAMTDLLAGVVDTSVAAIANVQPSVKAGKYRALAVFSPEREALMPDVPTFKELGFPTVVGDTWFGLFSPAGTPGPVLNRLGSALRSATSSASFGQAMRKIGNEPITNGPEELRKTMNEQNRQWGELIRRLNITAN